MPRYSLRTRLTVPLWAWLGLTLSGIPTAFAAIYTHVEVALNGPELLTLPGYGFLEIGAFVAFAGLLTYAFLLGDYELYEGRVAAPEEPLGDAS